MSLLTKTLFSNFYSKGILACNRISNNIKLTYLQYCSCLANSTNIQFRPVKYKENNQRKMSMLSYVKNGYSSIGSRLKNFFEQAAVSLPLFNSKKSTYIGYLWYSSLDEVKVEEFFSLLNMPDTFFSRFIVIELHVWMLLFILPQGNRFYTGIRYSVIRALWEDCQKRAKMMAYLNKNYRKNMKLLYEKFKMSMVMYDFGYYENDMSLANSVWYNFFLRENVDPRYIETLVRFIRFQVHHLSNLNVEQLHEQKNKSGIWFSVKPHFDEVMNHPKMC